jgi:hypothetical protein
MLNRRLIRTAVVVAALGMIASSSINAGTALTKVNRMTFTAPVRLPGVLLLPGTYVFESGALGMHPEIVRVTSANHQKLYYQGFTRSVQRPKIMDSTAAISFAEAPVGAPQSMTTWFPLGSPTGHGFIYR